MLDKTTTAIHGIHQAETFEGSEVMYVYPGGLTVKITEGVTMQVSSRVQEVELGVMLRDQDPLADESWRWEVDTKPATRRWAQHVLAASVRGQNMVYEHDGEVVLVWAFIPARADELALLASGFTPAMASWRALATGVSRELAAQMAARRPGPPVSALGEAPPPSPMAADNEDSREWPEHTWMRWAALTSNALSFGNKSFNLRKQFKYMDDLVLRYTGRKSEFDLAFNMAQHPLVCDVTIRGKIDHVPFSQVIPSVAWEDFEALFTEIGRIVKALPAAAPAADTFDDARGAIKALGLPPKKHAYYLRRAEEAIGEGKGWAPVVARARRVADKLSGVSTPSRPNAKQPRARPAVRVPAVEVTLDSFNAQPGWRAQQVRPRANGFVLAVFPEGRAMDAAVASVDVVDGEIDEVRWLDERLTQSVRDVITDRLDRALWAAYGDAGDDDDDDDDTAAKPRPSPLQDLIELMDRRSLALGARAANTADLGRKDGYANIASALRDLARPNGPTAEELQRWLETAELMSAGEVVGRARGAEPTSVRLIMHDLWAAVFEVLTREQVAGRPGALRLPAEAIFHGDDNAGDFVLQRVHQGERWVLRRIRVRVGELDEDTDEMQVEDPSDRLASGDVVHPAERPEQFFVDLYGKLGAFHDDLERAPRTLQDVRTLLYWAAVMLDAPLCQGDVKARAAAAFTQAKAFHDTARRALIEGRSVDAVRRMHEALARISAAAAEIARSCGEGQIDIAVTPPHLPVLPADKAAVEGLTSAPAFAMRRAEVTLLAGAAPDTSTKNPEPAPPHATMSGAKPTPEQLRERFSQLAQSETKPTMPTYYIFRAKSGRPELLTRADIEARARAAVGDAIYDEAERNPMPGSDLFASAVGAVELAMDAEFEGRADPRWAASILSGRPPREPEYYIFRTKSGLPELLTRDDIEARARAIVGDDAYREIEGNPMPGASTFEAAVNIVEESLHAEFEGRADPQWASSIQWGRQQNEMGRI